MIYVNSGHAGVMRPARIQSTFTNKGTRQVNVAATTGLRALQLNQNR